MKKNKLLLLIVFATFISGCGNTPTKTYSSYQAPTVSVGEEVYNWRKWDCYDYIYSNKHLLSIGYIKFQDFSESDKKHFISRIKIDKNDRLSEVGILFLKNLDPIYADYFLRGTRHSWSWDDYSITISSDGTGHYYDFTGISDGNTTESSDVYKCKMR